MKISKSAQTTARRIFRLCSPEGRIDEDRMRQAIAKLVEDQPRDYRAILAGLARLVRREEARSRVVVESAQFLDPATEQQVRDSLTKQYGQGLNFEFRTNPDLMGGMKIRVGDDVIDGSVAARIKRLETVFQ
ncbi:F0F1 ATP synthase subunit delta [Roseibacillus ishigakijimensis]|uniref:F0F1 ATP synthase subunit delta n=1 Tax=Roseibacillus ishigakijimensis TaxID=454146 RepID=A0A934VHZ3_9BACT|nr:F0F1 ATP synthase subunit delta [Roseibacillus ishigakijimensis]MBK1834513.1 F0F1 ATP synthase subunit delta [Roseibacillus ishigakijimensis]